VPIFRDLWEDHWICSKRWLKLKLSRQDQRRPDASAAITLISPALSCTLSAMGTAPAMEILSGFTKLIGIFCIVLLNGFFVAAEYAIVKVRITQIEPLAKKGNWRARRTHHVITHLDTYVSATQLGITLTSLGLGWIGEPFFAHGFLFLFASIGLPVAPWVGTLSVFLGFSLMSYVLIVAGELGPRWYALQNAQRVSLGLSTPLHVFYSVFRPFIWFLNHSASFLLRGVGITPAKDSDVLHSEEEMRLILGRGTDNFRPWSQYLT
jgi:CBS domain containing-hemolysin-like protein